MAQAYYNQQPQYSIDGLVLHLQPWRFSCGALSPDDPAYIYRDLPALDVTFTQDAASEKVATLYVVPTVDADGDNYYLTEWRTDPALAETSNPPAAPDNQWTTDISIVPCLTITIPAKGAGKTIAVQANEFDSGYVAPRDHATGANGAVIRRYPVNSIPAGWERLDAQKHSAIFPLQHGFETLPADGEVPCVEVTP